MYVEVRWILFPVVVVGVVVVGAVWPHLIPVLALGVTVAGVLYAIFRLGDRIAVIRPNHRKEPGRDPDER